ncbi:MAG: peptide deformylase [Deltaproteobacteria bacterium]|nr:peptide deformylase [Deltaproteobacteria bacterium]
MLLPILHYPDEQLRKTSVPLTAITEEDRELIENMIATMYDAPGVGLAAPQVGVHKRIVVLDTTVGKEPNALVVMINPEILSSEGMQTEEEGCLSVPGYNGNVARAQTIKVSYMTREGEQTTLNAEGLMARAIQHEVDHLDGILFVDRLSPLKRDMIKRKIKKAIRQGAYK